MSGKPHAIKPNRVGKVFSHNQSAAEELAFAKIVQKIDPQQKLFYYPNEMCFATRQDIQKELARGQSCNNMKSLPAKQNSAIQLIMPNGGQILTGYLKTTFGEGRMSRATMATILERLFFGVRRLLEVGYVHQDLKTPNIVAFAGPNGSHEVRIIDFGTISTFDDFYHSDTNFMMEGHEYYVNPPEYRIPKMIENFDYATAVSNIKALEKTLMESLDDPDTLASYRLGYSATGTPGHEFVKHNVKALERLIAAFSPSRDYDDHMKVLEDMKAANKADLWSMGTIMLRLTSFLMPAKNDDAEAVQIYNEMVHGLLQPNPVDRMSIAVALRMIKRLKKTGVLGSPVQNEHFHAVFPVQTPSIPPPTRPRPTLSKRLVAKRPSTQSRQSKQTEATQATQAAQATHVSPTPRTKLTQRLSSSTVRDLRASELYKKLAVTGKSRFKKDELISAMMKSALP